MFVKICGITNEDDALFAVAMGADAVGFVFAPSTRQIAPQKAYDITRRLPPEILTVGVFRDELPSRVIEIANRVGRQGGAAPRQGDTRPGRRGRQEHPVGHQGLQRHVARPAEGRPVLHRPGARRRPQPGFGQVVRLEPRIRSPDSVRLILAGGLDPDNVADAIDAVEPWGVDVSSGVESAPGRKDATKVRRFIANARAAAPTPYLGPDDIPYDWADE
jgi:phosphoribosylanthranilate isomerase